MTEPEQALNAISGKTQLTDQDLHKRINDFAKEADSVGFNLICSKSDTVGTTALLFRKVATKEPNVPNNKM